MQNAECRMQNAELKGEVTETSIGADSISAQAISGLSGPGKIMRKRISVRNLVEFILRSGSIDSRITGRNRLEEGSRVHRKLQKAGGYQAEVYLSITETHAGVDFTVEGRADGVIISESGVMIDEIKSTLTPLEQIEAEYDSVFCSLTEPPTPVSPTRSPAERVRVGKEEQQSGADVRRKADEAEWSLFRRHWAQAMCYGYIYCVKNDLAQIDVRLTYYEMETGGVKRFVRTFAAVDLGGFFTGLLEKYAVWMHFINEWKIVASKSMRTLVFPFDSYREGQRRFAAAVYKTIIAGERLFAMAPTGVGKTISTLFPAIKAMGEGIGEKIFYLTAKTITRQAAQDALDKMREGGLRAKSVNITAKDRICFRKQGDGKQGDGKQGDGSSALFNKAEEPSPCLPSERVCKPSHCEYADGHFDRVNDAIMDALQSCDDITAETVADYAKRHCVCPFELSLDISLWCDVVICDYNYVFDPQVYLKRFFSDGGDYVFLVDEAHNLADRARDMYTATISKRDLLAAKKTLSGGGKQGDGSCAPGRKHRNRPLASLASTLNKIIRLLLEKRKACETAETGGGAGFLVEKESNRELLDLLELFSYEFSKWLGENPDPDQKLLEAYFSVLSYLKIAEFYGENYAMLYKAGAGGELTVKQFCADPSSLLDERFSYGRAAVLFSATLIPPGYYMSVLGGGENRKYIALPSPFPRDNLLLLIADDISTRYKDREGSLERVADMIYHLAAGKTGNYIAYFPSYSYLSSVYSLFCEKYPELSAVRQEQGMAEDERDRFLAMFEARQGDKPGDKPEDGKSEDGAAASLIAFCVLGGIFSEGVDLPGDKLIGTAIAGVGLPQINTELDIVRDCYGGSGRGFDFAYRFPGMNKVLQAAGRVIRSGDDRGVVLLIDDRFTGRRYTELFPEHWQNYRPVRGAEELSAALDEFWGNNK